MLLEMDGISGYSRRAQIGEILEVHMRKFEHIVVIWDWYLMMICWYKDSISANHKSGEKMRLGDVCCKEGLDIVVAKIFPLDLLLEKACVSGKEWYPWI